MGLKLGKKKIQILVILALYLATLYFWTLPIQQGKIPFGEVDAASHFAVADYMSLNDKIITDLPPYIFYRYGSDNAFKPGALWYHPTYHMDLSIVQITGGRYIPFYLMIAVFCSLIVVILYYVISRMYGFWPGILSALLVAFSGRDYFVYFWGQWPERISHFFVPIILYLFYRYISSITEGKEKPIYFNLIGLMLGINMTLHPMGFFHSAGALAICYIFFMIKRKKIFVFKLKRVIIPLVLFLLIAAAFPYQTGNVIYQFKGRGSAETAQSDFSRLFSWFKEPDKNPGVPDFYFSFSSMHGLWTLPFILLGIFYLAFRRRDKDIILLGWLVSLYIILHADVFGKGPFIHRSLAASAHILAPLTAIGLISLVTLIPIFIKQAKQYKIILKFVLITSFIVLTLVYNAVPAYNNLNKAPVTTPNDQQIKVSDWLMDNLDEDSHIFDTGTVSLAKKRWMQVISQRHFAKDSFDKTLPHTYVLFDYSDFKLYGMENQANQLIEIEKSEFGNLTPIYNQGDIRVYSIEN